MKSYVICFLAFCSCTGLYAQNSLQGKIIDKVSNAVGGASVHLLNSNVGAVSNAQGRFTLDNVPAGNYTLEISAVGFAAKNLQVNSSSLQPDILVTLVESSQQLDEVVVTAEKREELLQRLPVSITSLSARSVTNYRLWNIREVTGIVPNLYSADPGDKRNVTAIRGITTTSYDPAVATYIDGVNQFTLDTYISPLFDVERIEVLRGPQGTLYGRNALGGVINIITRQPGNTTTGFAEVTVGDYGQQRYSAGIRIPVIKDKLFVGAAGLYDGSNGFFTNDFNNSDYDKQHSVSGNYYVKFIPDQQWTATLNIKHNNNRNYGPFPLVFGTEDAFANPYKLNQNALTRLIDNTLNTSLSLNYSGTGFNFSSNTSYQKNYRYYNRPIDADFSPIDGITLINNYGKNFNTAEAFTEELKFSSPANKLSPFNWTAGTYFFLFNSPTKTSTRFGEDALLAGANDINFSLINTGRAKGSGIAVFGQTTYALSDKFDITGGLRFDFEHKKQSVLGQYQKDPDPNPQFEFRSDTFATTAYSAFQPKISVGYHATEHNLLYVTYSRGYRAGGLTPLSSDPSQPALYPFKPEYSNNTEAGLKNSLYQNRLLINFSAFYTTVTDAQVPTLILPDAVTITKNTGKLTSKGVEAEIIATPFKGFELNYSFGYTHATYKTLKIAQNGGETDLKGKFQIFTPDVTSMLAAQYSLPLSKDRNVHAVLRGEWKYLGTQYFDLSNQLKQAPYSLLNARFGVSTTNWELMFYLRNISDTRYISYAYDFGAVHLGDPQTYGATIKVNF